MQAGLYNEPIEIWANAKTTNDYGEVVETMQYVCATKAYIPSKSGNRQVVNNETFLAQQLQMYVRYYVPITDDTIIKWQGKKYRILQHFKRRETNDIFVGVELINE